MAAPLPPVRRRRRPRRGSLERPVSSQLYRSAFLACSLPLLIAAFTVTRPGALQKPLLPPAFDARATLGLAKELATEYPDRSPGSSCALAAVRFATHSPLRDHIVAVLNLDALAGPGPPRLELAGDRPRSPAPVLVATATARVLDQAGARARHPGFIGQLVDLGFPFTLYE